MSTSTAEFQGLAISGIIDALGSVAKGGRPSLSFEFFPPKDDEAQASLHAAFARLLELNPDFVSVTYGAGGSNQERSFGVVEHMAAQVATIGHLTCVGATRQSATDAIARLTGLGVAGILALRGDAPLNNPDALHQGEFQQAVELVELVKTQTSVEIGVAAFPEGHPESANLDQDTKVLKLKQDAGASFAITQLFFFAEDYFAMIDSARAAGVTMPIVPGVMPISNTRQVLRMAELSGSKVPADLVERLEAATDEEAKAIGMEFTIELARQLLVGGAPGLHVYCLNQSKAATELVRAVGLA